MRANELLESFSKGDLVTYELNPKIRNSPRGKAEFLQMSSSKKNHAYIKTETQGQILVPVDELKPAVKETNVVEAKEDPFSPEVVKALNAKAIKGVKQIGVAHPGIIVVLSPEVPVKDISGVITNIEHALREIAGLKYFSRKVVAGLHGGSPFQVQIQAE